MESLFRDIAQGAGLDGVPAPAGGDGDEAGREAAFKAAWEAMLVEGMNGTMGPEDLLGNGAAGTAGAAGAAVTGAAAGTDSFQDHIRKTMDKLKESDHKVRACHTCAVTEGHTKAWLRE